MLISIEGTDGCGKQTQTEKLKEYLKEKGYDVIRQSFPNYESESSGPVKMYLSGEVGDAKNGLDSYQGSSLYAVDRLCTMAKLKDFYKDGGIIIFDRYVQSNMIHQAGKIKDEKERDKFLEWVDDFEFEKLKLPRPDLIIFLDLPLEISQRLANQRQTLKNGKAKDIHESEKSHLQDAHNAGKYVAKKYGWVVIKCDKDGDIRSIEDIHKDIVKEVEKVLK